MYKEGVSLNFSDGYIDPEEMMQDGSYPPTYPNNEPLLDPDDSYQQKDQLLRIVFNIRIIFDLYEGHKRINCCNIIKSENKSKIG